MSTSLSEPPTPLTETQSYSRPNHRSEWRQRLVDAERGISHGLKHESTLYVYLFGLTVLTAAGFVLGLTLSQWAILIVCMSLTLAAELFNMALRTLVNLIEKQPSHSHEPSTRQVVRLGTAATFCTLLGSLATVSLIFIHQLLKLWNG